MSTPGRPTSPPSQPSQPSSPIDSSPNPLDSQNDPAISSSARSSRVIDMVAEDEENTVGQRSSVGRVSGVTGPVGEAGLPPSRPSSIATGNSSKRRTWGQAPPSRKGHIPAFGSGSVAGSIGTRPGTASSKTHVPSLTPNAFFRPMSSQRLQAQRGQRPVSLVGQSSLRNEGVSETGSSSNRQSDPRSLQIGLHPDLDGPPPPSRGTDVTTDIPDRTTANTSPTGAETVRSHGESITPLHQSQQSPRRPTHLDLTKPPKNAGAGLPTPGKSPRSFRSSFILPSRGATSGNNRPQGQGHEKLSSAASSPRITRDDVVKEEVKKELGKNYQYFTGNTVFCWGGRWQNARDRPINIATGLLVIVPCILFLVFSAPWLWLNISPAIPILFGYLFLICVSSFFHASVTDPGILPRNLHPFPPPNPNDDPLTVGPPTTEWVMVVSATQRMAAMEVPTKYCKSCNIWRPPRAHHCRNCDNCIETQDHHCVWLNNCIGRRNYRYFFVFVSSGTLLGLFLLGASLGHILAWRSQEGVSFGHAINHLRIPFAMFVYGILATPYIAALWGYHLFLMGRGETTREYLNSHKFLKKDRHRPFTQGSLWRNLTAVLLRPRPPTYLHFKKEYEEGDQRFGPRRGKRTAPLVKEAQGGGMEMQDVSGRVPAFQGPAVRGPLGVTKGDSGVGHAE